MKDQFAHTISTIQNNVSLLASKKATAGFDGFVDTIVRVIKNKEENKEPQFFNTINDYGKYITAKSGSSFSLEYKEINTKLGGNMPITANALAQMGVHVNCIGALGTSGMHSVFKNLSSNCALYSFTNPGTAIAYEFADGKMILSQMDELNRLEWNELKNIIGLDKLINLYKESDLLFLLNWSEIDASTNIWKGILKDILPSYKKDGEKQIAFFDLSDCSKRSDDAIKEMLSLLKEFNNYAKVILSLNKNESRCIYEVLYGIQSPDAFKDTGANIYEKLSVNILLLHSSKQAIAFSESGISDANSFFIKDPVISTGAGDNFNAGFAAAQLLNLDITSSLIFANAGAALYIQSGISAQADDVIRFLENYKTD